MIFGLRHRFWILAHLWLGCQARGAPRDSAPAPIAQPPVAQPPVGRPAAPEYTGVIVAQRSVEVMARVAGQIAEVRVRLGDAVKKDEVLAALDSRAFRADADAAQAGLEAARAEAERTRLEASEMRERSARVGKLADFVSQEEASGAVYRERDAKIRHGKARADRAVAAAKVRQAQVRLDDAEIRAPFDGVVAVRYAEPGATVTPTTPLVRLIAADKLRVRFAVPKDNALDVVTGSRIGVRIDKLEATFAASVDAVAPEVDAAVGMLIVEARLELPEEWQGRVPAGVPCRVMISN